MWATVNYNIILHVRKYKYETWKKIVLWCHTNLSHGKDFYYSDEEVMVGTVVYKWPSYLWLANDEDLVALKLAVALV